MKNLGVNYSIVSNTFDKFQGILQDFRDAGMNDVANKWYKEAEHKLQWNRNVMSQIVVVDRYFEERNNITLFKFGK